MNNFIEISRALQPAFHPVRTFHTTFITRGKKILAIGINKPKTNPKVLNYNYEGESDELGTHSELAAVIKLGRLDCSKLTFFNVRLKKDGSPALAKPCRGCMDMLKQLGYKKIYYTNNNGQYEFI